MTVGQGVTASGRTDSGPTEPRERTPWLLAFLCLLIPALPSFVVVAGPLKSNGSPARMLAILLFGLVALGFILIRRTEPTRTMSPGVAIILLYFLLQLAVYGVGLTHVEDPLIEASKTRGLIVVTSFTGLALYAMTRIETTRQRTIVLGCLATGLTFACVVGLLQLVNIDLRYTFQPPGFVINVEDLTYNEREGLRRVLGTSLHPIEFAVLTAVTVPLTLHFARWAGNRWVCRLAMLACAIALLALPAAVSRSGIVALTAALLVYMWNFTVRRVAVGVVAAAAAVGAYVIAFPISADAMWNTITNSEEDPSIQARTVDYAMVGDLFRAKPIFGHGIGSTLPTRWDLFLDNEWLQQIVQGGSVGLASMLALAVGGIFGISAALRTASTPRERDQAYAIGAMFVAVLSSSITMDLFSHQQASFIMLMSIGLLWSNFKVPIPAAGPVAPAGHPRVE